MKSVAIFRFESAVYYHGSWGSRSVPKTHRCTMEFYESEEDANYAEIEWYIPSIDEVEHIGLSLGMTEGGKRKLIEYDGIMAMPAQAILVMQQMGIVVDEDAVEPDAFETADVLEGDEIPVRCTQAEAAEYLENSNAR